MVEPGIEPGTSWLVVRNSDHQATRLVIVRNIQSVSRLVDITAGGDFLGLCDQKVHIKVCLILDGYGVMGIFNSRIRRRVNRVLRNQLAGDVLNLVAYRLRCKHYFCHLTRAVHNRTAACIAAGGGIFENHL